jgi:hypothetical protein
MLADGHVPNVLGQRLCLTEPHDDANRTSLQSTVHRYPADTTGHQIKFSRNPPLLDSTPRRKNKRIDKETKKKKIQQQQRKSVGNPQKPNISNSETRKYK